MSKLKLVAVCLFAIPAGVYFLIWVIFFATTFKSQETLLKEMINLHSKVLSQGLPLNSKRDKELLDHIIDFAVHSSIITWLAVLVFAIN